MSELEKLIEQKKQYEQKKKEIELRIKELKEKCVLTERAKLEEKTNGDYWSIKILAPCTVRREWTEHWTTIAVGKTKREAALKLGACINTLSELYNKILAEAKDELC